MIVSMIANTARDPKKRRKPFTPSDFIPQEVEEERPDDWEALKRKSMMVFAMLGGRVQDD